MCSLPCARTDHRSQHGERKQRLQGRPLVQPLSETRVLDDHRLSVMMSASAGEAAGRQHREGFDRLVAFSQRSQRPASEKTSVSADGSSTAALSSLAPPLEPPVHRNDAPPAAERGTERGLLVHALGARVDHPRAILRSFAHPGTSPHRSFAIVRSSPSQRTATKSWVGQPLYRGARLSAGEVSRAGTG